MKRVWIIALFGSTAAALAGCATTPTSTRLDSFSLGRNAAAEPCTASRRANDPAVADAFDRAYAITCSNAAASRPLGSLRAIRRTPGALAALEAQFDCAERRDVVLAGERATAQRCLDHVTGLESVRIDLVRGARHYIGSATPALLPQLEEAVAVAASLRRPRVASTEEAVATIDLASLPERPAALGAAVDPVAPGVVAASDTAGALAQGISFNHKGQHVEASRVLNDALTRLDASASPALRAELLLEAGLADSNIRFPDAAAAHFAAADTILTDVPATRTVFLSRKRNTYRALDALNRGSFDEAMTLLDRTGESAADDARPLQNAAALLAVNQPAADGTSGALALADAGQLARFVLDAQSQYARSVALLGRGDVAGATTAIAAAAEIYRPLASGRIDQAQLYWLGARIARQQGRLQARRGDYDGAYDNFDRTVTLLRRAAIANAGTGNETGIAEAELERAAIFARTGASRSDVRDSFGRAVDALIVSGATTAGGSIGMEDYLDLLVNESARDPRADTAERFFRAVQASGTPEVARQITELRSVVTADPAVGRAVRERADLERELTRIRFALTPDADGEKPTTNAELERSRGVAEARLLAVDAQLAADPRYRTLVEAPATLAELRAALRPGEAFVKLTTLNRRIYGLVVTADRSFVYHVANGEAAKQAVMQLAGELRETIDGGLAAGQIVPFDEARAYTLFRLIAGPAADTLAKTSGIVVDPSGPLQQLPIGVLVTRYTEDRPRADAFDFSNTAFLASSASISTALSPRSFLISRALPASLAARSFIGLGQHQPPTGPINAAAIQVGYGCSVGGDRLGAIARSLKPISRRELEIAAGALGASGALFVTGASFSDTAVEARDDLNQYEVVHFATHGLEEGMWGCSKSPPALVTSFGGAGSDGLLDFTEVAKLRLDANLVVLSACDTAAGVRGEALRRASGQAEAGATLEGLVRAFLTANARSVLATYWQVSAEQESDEFMRAFYARARTATIGDALRSAQTTLIAQPRYSHPFYWAPYFLVGDSAKPMLTPTGSQVAAR